MLEVKKLSYARNGIDLFSELSFTLSSGEVLLVRGPNGSGKTTLLRTLCSLTAPTTGEIFWHGRKVLLFEQNLREDLVYLGHQPALKEELSVQENLGYALRLSGIVADSVQIDALERVGLADRRKFQVRQLSQGQKRRLNIARLILSTQKLWLLDEPLTALDDAGIDLLTGVIEQHSRAGGMAVMATHQTFPITVPVIKELRLQ